MQVNLELLRVEHGEHIVLHDHRPQKVATITDDAVRVAWRAAKKSEKRTRQRMQEVGEKKVAMVSRLAGQNK